MNDETFEPISLPGVAPTAAIGLSPSLAVGVTPIEPPAAMSSALHQRLLERVARSAAANSEFSTVRLSDGEWRDLAPGVRGRTQHANAAGSAILIELAPGAVLRFGDHAAGADSVVSVLEREFGAVHATHECLVLRGEVQLLSDELDSPTLRAQDYQFIGQDAAASIKNLVLSAPHGASIYWQSNTVGASEFGETRESHRIISSTTDGQTAWEGLREGVNIKPLHMVGERISMLVRFEPGARVPAHGHGLTESCLMVEGDLFLGDVLLREGEFQFAPAGSAHGELLSDVGCLLFFSGAIDPAAVDPAYRS